MNRNSHLQMGFIFGVTAIVLSGISFESIPLGLMVFFGSIFPDYDVAYGTHRKTLHNLWVMAACGSYMWFYGFPAVANLFFLLGFLSHLVADSVTKQGIMPFYPILNWKISGPITTGGWSEKAVMLLVSVGFIAFLMISFNVLEFLGMLI